LTLKNISKYLTYLNPDFIELEAFIIKKIEEINLEFDSDAEKLFTQKETVLITYADQFRDGKQAPLKSLNSFLEKDLNGCISHVHILPFYPWTSDDGFSPTDYQAVEKSYGTWRDIEEISANKMFDCVFNHISSESELFQKALAGDKKYQDMFHIYDESEYFKEEFQENINKVVRPRTSPLFTKYEINGENKYVWTTFSADQIDTNINNKDMVAYILDTLFLYIKKGARFLRIDAVPFMWKELGTNCSHLEKTHVFIKMLRAIVDQLKVNVLIITESNVPHKENITYWGNGEDEAHVIYNFSLAPLLLHAMTLKTNKYLNKWASSVFDNHKSTTFLNFTLTHDGIGMRGLEGIVPEEDIVKMSERTIEQGGVIGKKRSRDGSERPYELNITWSSYLKDTSLSEEVFLRKVINSHAVVMFFPGIAAHYAHNFLGTFNWQEGFEESGIARRLNRKKLDYPLAMTKFSKQVLNGLVTLINYKVENELFSPEVPIEVIEDNPSVLAIKRYNDQSQVIVLFNLTEDEQECCGTSLAPFELSFV
jgi:glycosidase